MAIAMVKTQVDGGDILAADWNTEFLNIINNAVSLVSPLLGDLALGGFNLTGLSAGSVGSPSLSFTGDTNTGIYSRTADTLNGSAGGVLACEFGASWILAAAPEDNRTNTVDVVGIVRSTTSGSPAASIGVGVQFDAESADENPCPFGRVDFAAADVTAGSEDTYFDVLLRVAGAALTSAYRFQSTDAFKVIFTHANSGDSTYTLPNQSDTLVGRVTTDTLTNKTLTSPSIGGATITGAAPASPAANVLYTDSIIKGWCYLTGATWTIQADLNVTSITDNGTGDFTINWATPFADAKYAVVATGTDPSQGIVVSEDTTTPKSTTVVRMLVRRASTEVAFDKAVSVIAIGNM